MPTLPDDCPAVPAVRINRPPHGQHGRGPRRAVHAAAWLTLVIAGLVLAGCKTKPVKPVVSAPPTTFTGPQFMHGTIGSLTSLRLNEPLPVSGFGLVVGLKGTGSGDVPVAMRAWMIQEMKKMGMGSSRLETLDFEPQTVLDSPDTAVVIIEGLIPPGAVVGSRFDVLVSAHPATETTSLEGGRLWTANLSVAGANITLSYTNPRATAAGAIYINPLESQQAAQQRVDDQRTRRGIVLAGGLVTETRRIELILHEPSYMRSALVANRINEVFRAGPEDRDETAVAKNDAIIYIYVPQRYAYDIEGLLEVISHMFVQRGRDFEYEKSQELATLLAENPTIAHDVSLCWQAMGKKALPVVREHYSDPNPALRLAAIESGVYFDDERVTEHLMLMSMLTDPAQRRRAAELLVQMPRSLRGSHTLQQLLDDEDRSVRLAAYESLSAVGDPSIERIAVGEDSEIKFVLDLVPAKKPLIYISQARFPRIAIFAPDEAGFNLPMMAKLWDNALMIRADELDGAMQIFYQDRRSGTKDTQIIAPTVANLVFLLAHKKTVRHDTPGFDLSYSAVVNALATLSTDQKINADIEIQISPLAKQLAAANPDFGRFIQAQTLPQPGTTSPDGEADARNGNGDGSGENQPTSELLPALPGARVDKPPDGTSDARNPGGEK